MLTESQLKSFEEDGFIGPLDSNLPESKIDNIKEYLATFVTSKAEHPLYNRFSVREVHLLNKDVLSLITQPHVVEVMKQILGPDLALWRSKIFYKSPGDGAIEWHQEWGAFNGEEIGNDIPALVPKVEEKNDYWNLTVWFALHDIDETKAPMQFIRRSYKKRYPIEMVSMVDSAFWQDPFKNCASREEIITKCNNGSLVLDINTTRFLDDVDLNIMDTETLKKHIYDKCAELKAAYTCDFDYTEEELVTMPMKKGQFVIFPERTMHRSIENLSDSERVSINFRVTPSSTLIYPGRLKNEFYDGSNLNIKDHASILLSGEVLEQRNKFVDPEELVDFDL